MRSLLTAAVIGLFAASLSSAQVTYTDQTGDTFAGGVMDIVSLEIDDDGTDLSFTLTLSSSIASPNDWGNYMIAIDSIAGGDTTGNAWNRPISLSSGMDYWIGAWVNGANLGHQVWDYDITAAGVWTHHPGSPRTVDLSQNASGILSLTVPLAELGLNPGDSFVFDVFSSGGGPTDSAVDSLYDPNQTIVPGGGGEWNQPYNSVSTHSYTTTIPEPGALALVGIGALIIGLVRVFRRR